MLGDQAYGDNTELRERLHDAQREYVLSVGAETKVFAPGTTFTVPTRSGTKGRPPSRPRADRDPEAIGALIARLGPEHWQTVTFRDGPDDEPMTSRFAFVRVRAAHRWHKGGVRCWLCPRGGDAQPPVRGGCWVSKLSNLPRRTACASPLH